MRGESIYAVAPVTTRDLWRRGGEIHRRDRLSNENPARIDEKTDRGIADDPSGKDHALVAAMRDVASDWAAWTCAERLLAATLLMLIVLVLPFAFLLDGALG